MRIMLKPDASKLIGILSEVDYKIAPFRNDRDLKSLGQLAEVIGAELPPTVDPRTIYTRVLTQQEYVQQGDVVIDAGWYNSKKVIQGALDKGVCAVFCSFDSKRYFPQNNVIPMEYPLIGVQRYERWKLDKLTLQCITITGSVGKTTTTGLINSVISDSFDTFCGHSMANSHGAILRHIQKLTSRHKFWVQEVGGVQPGYITSSACILRPNITVLTNIGESHLNTYLSKENIFEDKSSLERFCNDKGVVVISYDDDFLRNATYSHRVITCSVRSNCADYYAKDIQITSSGTTFTIVCKEGGSFPVHLNLYGKYNAIDALFATAVGRYYNISMERIITALESYVPSGMRQNYTTVGGYSFMVDVFNAEPKTVLGSAETLTKMTTTKKRKIFITGHIDKLGNNSARMHADLGHKLAEIAPQIDKIVFFAGDSRYAYEAMLQDGCDNVFFTESRDELDNWIRENVTWDDLVFYKSGQFKAALAKSIDHVFGTCFQNEQQFNEGKVINKDGYRYRLRQDGIAELINYFGSCTELIIPETIDGYVVTRIAPFAFKRQRKITRVDIPDSVIRIGQEAFYICPALRTLKLPSQLRFIGSNAFNYCKSLKMVELPYGVIHIDRHAFYDCTALESIVIPPTVGFFGDEVFGTTGHTKTDCTIVCKENSRAERYAISQGLSVALYNFE